MPKKYQDEQLHTSTSSTAMKVQRPRDSAHWSKMQKQNNERVYSKLDTKTSCLYITLSSSTSESKQVCQTAHL